jgi:tRNA A-37 threonylcarbamoyl transferase component Bud32
VRAALVGRYAIERELGKGGMATVYLARDLRYERRVAVKVLHPALAAALGSDRFLQEIRITAQLNHPHILPLLDSGEADGLLYYVMPYVAGGSLRGLLSGETRLPLDAAVRITQQVALALEHAHRHGVVHRDVKPENILFSEGHAVVTDFGIAKAVSAAGPESLTRSGFTVGTPGYMSPEQGTRITDLDQRTDVYSLACVVYEMLADETPAVWPMEEAQRLGRFIDAPPEQRECLDRLPGRVEQVLVRALAVRPADRFASPVEFADALAAAAEGSVKLSETQVREIIGRAAELEAEGPAEEGALSIGAVEQIAAEVGIAPQHVREAAEELGCPPGPGVVRKAWPASKPFEYRRETLLVDRTVEGELPESAHSSLVEEIQSTLRIAGHVSTVGRALTWSPAAPGSEERKVVVTITPHAGQTRVHIEERLELSGWRIFIPGWGVGGGVAIGALLMAALGAPERAMAFVALACGAAGGFLAVRSFYQIGVKRRKPQLMQLADRLAALVGQSARPALEAGPRHDSQTAP